MKTRIGHLLTRANLVSEAQLARTLEVQNFAGGRIGTLLLERGILSVAPSPDPEPFLPPEPERAPAQAPKASPLSG